MNKANLGRSMKAFEQEVGLKDRQYSSVGMFYIICIITVGVISYLQGSPELGSGSNLLG
jgi:hypothetical protein